MKDKIKNPYFLHVPKTGGTFLSAYLAEYCQKIHNFGHQQICKMGYHNNNFTFAFIRNPFAWYVSRYFYFCQDRAKSYDQKNGISYMNDGEMNGEEFRLAFPTFKYHIMYGYYSPKKLVNRFFLSDIYNWQLCEKDVLQIDYIGKLETIYDDIDRILDICEIYPDISLKDFKTNRMNKTDHNHYSTYYDQELINIIKEKDRYLLLKYNYKMELQ
jgi:hypothetical protein